MLEDKVVKNKVNINTYNEDSDKVGFSDGTYVEGSFIATDENLLGKLDINTSIDKFLSNIENFLFLNNYLADKEIFIVGCGRNFIIPESNIKKHIESLGFGLEWTTTNSAYRVFNAVVQDYRTCVALFISDF